MPTGWPAATLAVTTRWSPRSRMLRAVWRFHLRGRGRSVA